jgi:HlyD family secretion protein
MSEKIMKMKKVVIISLVLICVLGGYFYYDSQNKSNGDDLTLYGNVDIRYVNLAFQQAGRLEELLVEEGDSVKKGELLAKLDAKSFKNKVDVARANLLYAKAELANTIAGSRDQEIAAAYQAIKRLEAKVVLTKATLKRQTKLYNDGAVSKEKLDDAIASYKESEALLAAAKEQYSLLLEGADKDDLAIANAKVAIQKAQLESAEITLNETKLYAPVNAIVQSRILEPGAMVGTSAPILTLSVRSPLYIRTYVDEPNLGKIRMGQKVNIYTDTNSKVYHGHVGFISGTTEFTPKTVQSEELRTDLVYRVRIIVDDATLDLNQGQPVTIKINKNNALEKSK